MSNIQLNFYSNTDTSLIDLMNTADGTFIGKHQVSLTNYDNTSLPAVAVGSIVEVNGTLYKFTSESAISGSPSDGVVYIYLVPSGDPALGTATVTPTFVNTAPTWSDSKQGWYGTVGSANYRYLEFKMTKATASYSNKTKFFYDDNITIDTIFVNYGFVNPIMLLNGSIHGATTIGAVYTALSSFIPSVNDDIKICGGVYNSLAGNTSTASRVYRSSSTQIVIQAIDASGAFSAFAIDSGSGTAISLSISW